MGFFFLVVRWSVLLSSPVCFIHSPQVNKLKKNSSGSLLLKLLHKREIRSVEGKVGPSTGVDFVENNDLLSWPPEGETKTFHQRKTNLTHFIHHNIRPNIFRKESKQVCCFSQPLIPFLLLSLANQGWSLELVLIHPRWHQSPLVWRSMKPTFDIWVDSLKRHT